MILGFLGLALFLAAGIGLLLRSLHEESKWIDALERYRREDEEERNLQGTTEGRCRAISINRAKK